MRWARNSSGRCGVACGFVGRVGFGRLSDLGFLKRTEVKVEMKVEYCEHETLVDDNCEQGLDSMQDNRVRE